jgi:hypothetical protein
MIEADAAVMKPTRAWSPDEIAIWKSAKAAGASRFTGKTCSICGDSERFASSRACITCHKQHAKNLARKRPLARAVRGAEWRSKKYGLDFNILESELQIPEVCPVLGIPMSKPSIDRWDNSQGYTKENVKIISWQANHLKNNLTLGQAKSLVRYMEGQKSSVIETYSGAMFDYDDPDASQINIQDVALALANICRFAGQISRFYSVAQHCVNASRIAPAECSFDALMHDAAESLTGDWPTPLKDAVPSFRDLEYRIEAALAHRFQFQFPLPPAVKVVDLQMLKLEKDSLKPNSPHTWKILEGVKTDGLSDLVDLSPWTPEFAQQEFLRTYEELRPRA